MQKKDTNAFRRHGKFPLWNRCFLLLGFFMLPLGLFLPGNALRAHEPIFGVGPRTIWQGGFGFETGLEPEIFATDKRWALGYHTIYGITEDWAVSLAGHQPLEANRGFFGSFENLLVQSKYRFFQNDVFGGVYHAAVFGQADIPLAHHADSHSTTGIAGGLSGAYEGRRWLAFGTGRYRLNTRTTGQEKPGNVFLYDLALGFRPVMTGFYEPDVVLMAELNGRVFGATTTTDGTPVANTGEQRLRAAFGAWVTYRNWAFRPGIQLPITSSLSGKDFNSRWVVEIEIHI